ncbi:MAG: FAD-dependent oxidoreductase [Pseudomonadota bacterium]
MVIIGAGMAGIACARALKSAGVPVRLIDKGRGIGGRVATRRVEVAGDLVTFDHGTQYLDDSAAAKAIAGFATGSTGTWDMGGGKRRLVGIPGMSALPKALAEGLDVTLATRMVNVTEEKDGWHIQTETGQTTATHLVITVPAPQLSPLLGQEHHLVQSASKAVFAPCLTLMAVLDADTSAPFVTRRDAAANLTWIARNDSKPDRVTGPQTWVAQAHPDWSARHINNDRDETKARMAEMLCDVLQVETKRVQHTGLQGWRYGLVQTPLGRPFLSHGTLWIGGDWCIGGKVQDAWCSGTAIAADLLQHAFLADATRAG